MRLADQATATVCVRVRAVLASLLPSPRIFCCSCAFGSRAPASSLPSPRSCNPPPPPRVGPSAVRPYIHMDGSPRLRLVGHNQANPPRDRHRWWRPTSPHRGCHCRALAQPHAPHPPRGVGGDGGCGSAWGARPPSSPPRIRLTPTGPRRRWPSAGTTQRRSDRQPPPRLPRPLPFLSPSPRAWPVPLP